MLEHILYLALGLALVCKGGDLFVDSSVDIARVLNVPRILIGGTLVSIATTMPEMVVSSTASVMGDSGIAVGNAVGSAIANIGLIVGLVAFISPIHVELHDFKRRSCWLVAAAFLLFLFLWTLKINRWQSSILLAFSFAYLYGDYIKIRKEKSLNKHPSAQNAPMGKMIMIFIFGAFLVVIGSWMLVVHGIKLAEALNIPSVIIGLTLVAVGTSLPELVTGVSAALKGVPDLSIGNIFGANVLNLTMIIGVSGMIHPLSIQRFTQVYSFSWLAVFIAVLIFALGRSSGAGRKTGILFLVLYVSYISGLIYFR